MSGEEFQVEAIGYVRSTRSVAEDDDWERESSHIELIEKFPPDSLAGLSNFSHCEVLYLFHQVDESRIVTGARHPRNNPAWPKIGIFAQRGKNRPNRIGSTICRVVEVVGRTLAVAGLDAIDGTPVIDIKPVMNEFLPRETVTQPSWVSELMSGYWRKS